MIQEINESQFQNEVLDSDKPVLVDFWAPWCGPCRMVAPAVQKIGEKYSSQLKVLKINTDENQNVSAQMQITGIPCLILFKAGQEVHRMVGVRPQEMLESEIQPYLN